MRPIDADAIIPKGTRITPDNVDLATAIRFAPTVDAVPVVRCRECKHWKKGEFQAGYDAMHLEYGGYCPNSRFARYESDFCSYGERKEGADNGRM